MNKYGENFIIDAKYAFNSLAEKKEISSYDLHLFIMNVNYNKKINLNYNDEGIKNPMIIDNFVFRTINCLYYHHLQARPKLVSDTLETLETFIITNGSDFIDSEHDSSYVTISTIVDH